MGKYYNSFNEYEDNVKTPEEMIASAEQALKQAKIDAENQELSNSEFSEAYNKIVKQGKSAMREGHWESIKDELFGLVKALMVKYNISDLSILKNRFSNLNKIKAHNYFSDQIQIDAQAKAEAEKARIEKEVLAKKAEAERIDKEEKEKAEKEKAEKEALEPKISGESKEVAQNIKNKLKAPLLTTQLVGKALPSVKLVQELLIGKGADIKPDGKYGGNTKNAVKAYQANNNLDSDGVVGNGTWKKLLNIEEDLNIKNIVPKSVKTYSGSDSSTDTRQTTSTPKTTQTRNVNVEKGFDVNNLEVGDAGSIDLSQIDWELSESKILEKNNPKLTGKTEFKIIDDSTIALKIDDKWEEYPYSVENGKIKITDWKDNFEKVQESHLFQKIKEKFPKRYKEGKNSAGKKRLEFESNTYGKLYLFGDGTFIRYKDHKPYATGTFEFNEKNSLIFSFKDNEKKKKIMKWHTAKIAKKQAEELYKKDGVKIDEKMKKFTITMKKLYEAWDSRKLYKKFDVRFETESWYMNLYKVKLTNGYYLYSVNPSRISELSEKMAEQDNYGKDATTARDIYSACRFIWNKTYMKEDRTSNDDIVEVYPAIDKLTSDFKESEGESLTSYLNTSLGSWDETDVTYNKPYDIKMKGKEFREESLDFVEKGETFSQGNRFVIGPSTKNKNPNTYYEFVIEGREIEDPFKNLYNF